MKLFEVIFLHIFCIKIYFILINMHEIWRWIN